MKKTLFFGIVFMLLSSMAFAAPIDLRAGWEATAGGTWTVASDGSNVLQTVNGHPTVFYSATQYIDTTFDGSFGVETRDDDDFIGFVFGYNGPSDYLLFDWKQKNQSTALEGFTLSKISGTTVDFWAHTGADITVLGTSYSTTSGWADYTSYDFHLDYTTTEIKIAIDGTQIFDVDGTFSSGAFGFYNYSQSQVRYAGFEEEVIPPGPVPEPSTILLMGAGLLGLVGYRRKRSKK